MAEKTTGETAPEQARTPPKAIFRVPGTALLAVVFLAVCVTPVAFAAPGLVALYVLPLALAYWVLRVRTVADHTGLTARTLFASRELPWADLKGLALVDDGTKVVAVLADDSRVPLPLVRTRNLPVLSLVSGGRIDDPSGQLDTPPESPKITESEDVKEKDVQAKDVKETAVTAEPEPSAKDGE